MKDLTTYDDFITEGRLSPEDFPKFEKFIESQIPKKKAIALFIEDHRILIGYYPRPATVADISKVLPSKVTDSLEKKFAGSKFTTMREFKKMNPLTGKENMKFVAISAPQQSDLKGIEKLF